MARSKWTLDDAAVAVIQLESGDMEGARRLRERLRRLQGRSDEAVAAALAPALDALVGWKGLTEEEQTQRLADTGGSIEAAMVARDELAIDAASRSGRAEGSGGSTDPGIGAGAGIRAGAGIGSETGVGA